MVPLCAQANPSCLCTVPIQTPWPNPLSLMYIPARSDSTPNLQVPTPKDQCHKGYHVQSSIDELDFRADSFDDGRVLLLRGSVVARCASFEDEAAAADAFSFSLAAFSVLLSRAFFLSEESFLCSSFFLLISAFCATKFKSE
jgi:hypothetical protein